MRKIKKHLDSSHPAGKMCYKNGTGGGGGGGSSSKGKGGSGNNSQFSEAEQSQIDQAVEKIKSDPRAKPALENQISQIESRLRVQKDQVKQRYGSDKENLQNIIDRSEKQLAVMKAALRKAG